MDDVRSLAAVCNAMILDRYVVCSWKYSLISFLYSGSVSSVDKEESYKDGKDECNYTHSCYDILP